MNETVKIGSREYPVIGYVRSPAYGDVPLVDLPMMSDQRWNELAERSVTRRGAREPWIEK